MSLRAGEPQNQQSEHASFSSLEQSNLAKVIHSLTWEWKVLFFIKVVYEKKLNNEWDVMF